jgi:hypothetical protein
MLTFATNRTSVAGVITVATRDSTGVIYIRDHRDDGSYVVLECRELVPAGGDGAVIVLPDRPETFPMLRAAGDDATDAHAERTQTRAFKLEIDISGMRAGALHFVNHDFIEQAAASAENHESVAITPENAAQWGYRALDMGSPA